MHIPDNYLSPSTCAVMAAAMVPVWTRAVHRVKSDISQEKMPLLGIGAAFSFLGMMFNVPLPGGTTGHAVGGTLIAVTLGPDAACLSITIALLIQALLFGDGGVLTFGANCFNMAFVLPYLGYAVYELIYKRNSSPKRQIIAAGIGSYIGINAAAFCAAVEFGIQPLLFRDAAGQALYCPYPLSISIPAMALGHLTVAGIAEVIFTTAVFAYLRKVSPGTLYAGEKKKTRPIALILAVLIAAVPLGLLAPGEAWGEWELSGVAGGFSYSAIFPDYSMGNLPEWFGYILSAAAGTAIAVIIFKLIASSMKDKNQFA